MAFDLQSQGLGDGRTSYQRDTLTERNRFVSRTGRAHIYIYIQENADERTPRIYDWLTGGRSRSVPGTSPWILNTTHGLTQNS